MPLASTDTQGARLLTPREQQIICLLYMTSQEIAADLGISVRTVNSSLQIIYTKLGLRNRTAAYGYWLERQQRNGTAAA